MAQVAGRLQRRPAQDLQRRISKQASKASSIVSSDPLRLNSISDNDDEVDSDDAEIEYDTRAVKLDLQVIVFMRQTYVQVLRRAEIQQELNMLVLIGRDGTGMFSRLIHQARAITPGPHVPDDDLVVSPLNICVAPSYGFKVAVRNRTLAQAVANNKSLQSIEPNLPIRRRLCHPCRIWREAFNRGWSDRPFPDEDAQVYRFRSPSIEFRESLLRLIASYNLDAGKRGLNPLNVLLYRHVLEFVSAGRIQCLWRGWRQRRYLGPALHKARRRRRAAVCLAHAWRYHLLRLRFRMLHDAAAVCSAIQSSKLFLSRPALDLLLNAPNPFRRLRLFPEFRIRFDIVEGLGNQVVFRSSELPSRPIPDWLGFGNIAVEFIDERGRDNDQLRSGLRDLVQCQTALELKVLPPNSNQFDTEALWLVEFPDMVQARLRAALLLIHTWEPITGTFCHARPAICDTDGNWLPIGAEVKPPVEYRDVPVFSSSVDDNSGETGGTTVLPVVHSSLNTAGVDSLLRLVDRELVEVDPDIAVQHGISGVELQELIEEAAVIDDVVDTGDFLLSDLENNMDGYDKDLDSRMHWQAINLQLDAFYPNAEANADRAEVGLQAKMALAVSVRKESDHLITAGQTERERDLERKKKLIQTQRDLHHIRSNLNRIRTRHSDDHCQSEIATQRHQRLEQLRSMIHKAKMRKRQFQKDQMIEKRIFQVQRHTDRINERQQLTDAIATADGAARARIAELRSIARTALAIRANRDRVARDGLHFRRQLCQISKQIRTAQAQEAGNLRAALTARDVQVRKIRDARLRQAVHDRLLSEFNRKRQNAIVQQLRIRDQIEQKRSQDQSTLQRARTERHQRRQIREQIAEEIATYRDILRVDLVTHEFDGIASNLTQSMDADLTSRLSELETLANNVRLACTRVFNSA